MSDPIDKAFEKIDVIEKDLSEVRLNQIVYHKRLHIVEENAKCFDDAMRGTLTVKGFMTEMKESISAIRSEVEKLLHRCVEIESNCLAYREKQQKREKDNRAWWSDWKTWAVRFAVAGTWAALIAPKLKQLFHL